MRVLLEPKWIQERKYIQFKDIKPQGDFFAAHKYLNLDSKNQNIEVFQVSGVGPYIANKNMDYICQKNVKYLLFSFKKKQGLKYF